MHSVPSNWQNPCETSYRSFLYFNIYSASPGLVVTLQQAVPLTVGPPSPTRKDCTTHRVYIPYSFGTVNGLIYSYYCNLYDYGGVGDKTNGLTSPSKMSPKMWLIPTAPKSCHSSDPPFTDISIQCACTCSKLRFDCRAADVTPLRLPLM